MDDFFGILSRLGGGQSNSLGVFGSPYYQAGNNYQQQTSFVQQAQLQQAANPYGSSLMLQGLQQSFQPMYPWHNPFEIGTSQWERKEWDKQFAESMKWDKAEFYIQLGGIKP